MKTAFRHAALAWFVISVTGPMAALAEEPFFPARHEVTLDIDKDGKMDRAVIVPETDIARAELSIYLAANDESLSGKPTFRKTVMLDRLLLAFESKGNGSLILGYGCGGCSNDYETTLTIIHRDGEFLVAGYTFAWDTRNGIGSCDIDLLTGQGVMTEGLDGEGKPIDGEFAPVRLADWSDDGRPEACEL